VDLSDVLDNAEQLKVVKFLDRLTQSDKIAWQPNGQEASITDYGSHVYRLDSLDGDGVPPYRLSVRRKVQTGQQINQAEIAQVVMRTTGDPKADVEINRALRELYELAYRKSRRKVSRIDDFLNELDELGRGDGDTTPL
jgi:hypothetical protein